MRLIIKIETHGIRAGTPLQDVRDICNKADWSSVSPRLIRTTGPNSGVDRDLVIKSMTVTEHDEAWNNVDESNPPDKEIFLDAISWDMPEEDGNYRVNIEWTPLR